MSLQAGAAAVDISPCGPVPLFGYPHVKRISIGIHDPLYASALFLGNDSGEAVVLLALDLLLLSPPDARELRAAVASELSIPGACVFISCTHTHSGPVTGMLKAWEGDIAMPEVDPAYLREVREKAIAAAAEAAGQKRSAELAWTTAEARGVGGNRVSPEGVTDPEVGVLVVREAGGGSPLAVALVYGMHPTVLHEDSTLVSADFPGYARLHLQETFGESLTVVYHNAPCGNQSPRYYVNGQTFEESERLGGMLGKAVAASLHQLSDSDFSRDGSLAGRLQSVDLPRRRLPDVKTAELTLAACREEHDRLIREGAARARVRTAECAIFGAESRVVLAKAQESGDVDALLKSYEPIEVQAVRLGGVCLVGLPGELFTEYALQLKERAPCKTFVVTLVNGELQGYIVTSEAAAAGGYEAANSLFAPEAGEVLAEAGAGLVDLLWR